MHSPAPRPTASDSRRKLPHSHSPHSHSPHARRRTLRRDLAAILGDGLSYSLMVGCGETYLPLFVLAMGLGEIAAGLVSTIPLVVGAVLQLVSPTAVAALGSHRRWVVACAIVQACSFLPLATAAWHGSISTLAVFAIAAVYWGAGLGTGPAWNTWVETLVPARIRPHYFARRTRWSQFGVLVGFVAGGTALEIADRHSLALVAFIGCFGVACSCRIVSAACLASQSEPLRLGYAHRRVRLTHTLKRLGRGADGRLLAYLLAVQTAVQISGPYFTPYMRKVLHLSFAEYTALVAVSYLTKIVAMPACGRLAHRLGARRLLWIGGVGIVPLAGLWALSDRFAFLVVVQFASGIMWACYELAMFLMFFETIPRAERTSVLTSFNLAHSLATAAGSLFGGAVLLSWGTGPSTYWVLFVLSSSLRVVALIGLARVRSVEWQTTPIATRTIGMRATDGSLDQPVLPSLESPPIEPAEDRRHQAGGSRP